VTSLGLGHPAYWYAAASPAMSNNAQSDEFLFDKLPENFASA
jgi:hypothetical protein